MAVRETEAESAWEQRWLEHSRRVATDVDHRDACAAMGGSPDDPRLTPDVRWPGYAGARYRPGGVLWVNLMHRELHIHGELPAEIDAMAFATREWAGGRIDDDAYLAANRAGYEVGLAEGGWKLAEPVQQLLAAVHLNVDQIAYANVARCQLIPETPYKSAQARLVKFCQEWSPVRELVEALRPGLVYTTATSVASGLDTLPGSPMVVAIGPRGQRSPHGWQPKQGTDPWTAIAAEYARRGQKRAGA